MTRSLLGLAILFASACATETSTSSSNPSGPESFPAAPLTTIQSQAGAYAIEVRTGPSQPPSRGETAIELTVKGADGQPLDGLVIRPVLWMPVMGHGSAVEPTVKSVGNGSYVIDKCELYMAGEWELRTTISGADSSGSAGDEATAQFQVP